MNWLSLLRPENRSRRVDDQPVDDGGAETRPILYHRSEAFAEDLEPDDDGAVTLPASWLPTPA